MQIERLKRSIGAGISGLLLSDLNGGSYVILGDGGRLGLQKVKFRAGGKVFYNALTVGDPGPV